MHKQKVASNVTWLQNDNSTAYLIDVPITL